MKFIHKKNTPPSQTYCYMLFPLIQGGSLRDEITKRKLLSDRADEMRPFDEWQILKLFRGVLRGVMAMHDKGYAHGDIKLENFLLDHCDYNNSNSNNNGSNHGQEHFLDKDDHDEEIMMMNQSSSSYVGKPILMDFGSTRNLVIQLKDRRTILQMVEEASIHSTICYRAPELFDGGCRHGPLEADVDGRADVWSCGCLLYGLMYGSSPFEMEFRGFGSEEKARIVECSHLRILGSKIPYPTGTRKMAYNYRKEMHELVEWILTIERTERPTIEELYERVEGMLIKTRRGGGGVVV